MYFNKFDLPISAYVLIIIPFSAGCSSGEKPKNLTNDDLFNFLRGEGVMKPLSVESRNFLLKKIREKHNGYEWSSEFESLVLNLVHTFTISLHRKWSQCNRTITVFTKKHSEWLKREFILPTLPSQINYKTVGRPKKNFETCTERIKKQKISSVVKSFTSPELTYAVTSKLHKSGKRSAALLFKELTSSPNRALKMRKSLKNTNISLPIPYSPNEAVAFIMDNNLTKKQYTNIRIGSKARNSNIYPSYDKVLIE